MYHHNYDFFHFSGNEFGDRKENAWFGVSVISAGYNGYVMVSKPKYFYLILQLPFLFPEVAEVVEWLP